MCAERVVSYVQYESCKAEQLEEVDLEVELLIVLLKRYPLITRHSCTTAAQVEHPTQKGDAVALQVRFNGLRAESVLAGAFGQSYRPLLLISSPCN